MARIAKKYVTIATLCVVALGSAASVQAAWHSIDGSAEGQPVVQTVNQTDRTVTVAVTVPGFETDAIMIDGEEYATVALPGHVQRLERGLPQLPYITAKLIVADVGVVSARVVASEWVEIATAPVAPSKGVILRTVDPATVPYEFADIYRDGGVFPAEEIELGEPYIVRDWRGANVRVNALRWDATRGVLLALRSMTFELETSGTGGINAKQRSERAGIDPQFAGIYDRGFVNYDGGAKYQPVTTGGPMLIVCYDAFVATMAPFVEWKSQRGMDVELITTSSCGGTVAGIQAAINERYYADDGLTYVVLVGDRPQLPCYSGTYEGADDDTRYAMVEGNDLYPDLFVSRISGSVPVDIQKQVNKFIRYEKQPDAGGDWYHMAAGLASNEGSPPDYERANWLRADLLGYTFSHVDQIYQPSGTAAQISAAVNAGRSLVNYIGHGSGVSWSNPPFNIANVYALSNGWAQPWILDVSCSNGDFSNDVCFAEAWLRVGTPEQPNGAIAMYSASTSTPWVPPCVMQAEAIDVLVAEEANEIGALCFYGIMQVLDQYPGGTGTQLVEQYNIFGDCSLQVRTDTPNELVVVHDPVVPLFADYYSVDTGLPGVTCALYGDGVLHGVAVTDAGGHADIELIQPISDVGEVQLTVFGYNQLTYVAAVQAVVPADIAIVPATVPVGVATDVTVTVTDPDNGSGMANVTIYIEGYGVADLAAVTDAAGQATITVVPEYGEVLTVRGREAGATYNIFTEPLPVTGALALADPSIAAAVAAIGLEGALTPHIEGTVTAETSDSGPLVLYLTGGGLDTMASSPGSPVVVGVTPTELSDVTAALARSGYGIFLQTIPVVEAFGTLNGAVVDADAGDAPVAGANVRGFAAGDDPAGTPLFELTTDGAGLFTVADELAVGYYDIYIAKFGYLSAHELYFLSYGANEPTFALNQAPSGVVTGTVTSVEDGSFLDATITLYRSDNGELYDEVTTDPQTGVYTTGPLPYFDYNLIVRSYRFVPQSMSVSVASASQTIDFALEPTNGDLLIIDDNPRDEMVQFPAKLGKRDQVLAEAYAAPAARSALQIQADLEELGYTTTTESVGGTDPATWPIYDLIIVASGNNTGTLNTTIKGQLVGHVAAGGKVLIEGGEVAYDHQNDAVFAQTVLHIDDWNHDSSGSLTVADPSHYVMSVPNAINGPVALSYNGYGDADAVTVAADAARVGSWTSYPSDGSVIAFDPNPAPAGGQIVFFTFNYLALATGEREELLHNAVNWLITPEFGNSSIAGRVDLIGQGDDSGVQVRLTPGDVTVVTDASGSFLFDGLFTGDYHLTAIKEGWTGAAVDVALGEDEQLTGVEMALYPILSAEFCDTPGVAIPDNDPAGVAATLDVGLAAAVGGVEVYVDITHTYIGDLVIDLTSPTGTTVRLHNHQGGGGQDIVGWYPLELTPYQSLDAFIGEEAQGTWTLHVVDGGPWDTGTLNAWCLRLSYVGGGTTPVDADGGLPAVLSLDGNYPNPFNPMTTIKFSVPVAQQIQLAVFDLRGQRVATLVDRQVPAGRHTVTWSGLDDYGRQVSSGTYFYRLTAGEQTITSKMLLLK